MPTKENPEYHKKPCCDCGAPKEYGYRNSARCSKCTEILRKSNRLYTRKSPHGTGRKPTCSTCGILKEPGRGNESRCIGCKAKATAEKRAKARQDNGLAPIGSGRKKTCCRCENVKENPKAGYCNECERKHDNEWRIKTGRTLKHRTGMCQCGKPFASYSKTYCTSCVSKKAKEYRDKNPEKIRMMRRRAQDTQKRKDDWELKTFGRRMVRLALRSGVLERGICEVCATDENVDAHHDDYMQPLNVRWLCRKHHAEHHKNEKLTQEI